MYVRRLYQDSQAIICLSLSAEAIVQLRLYSGLYLKRHSHTNFYSYVVGTERETKDLHSELSLRIRSHAHHMVKSPKKEQDDGLKANWYYEIISWKPVHLKSPIGFKYPYLLTRPIGCTGFNHAKQQQSNIWELLFWLGQIACQMSPNPKINQKPTTVPPHISVNNGRMGTFQVAILCACAVIRHMCHIWTKYLFIFGAAVLGEASETMVELCLWPSILLLRKLAIWNLVFTGSYDNIGILLRMGFYVWELIYREKL